MFIKYLLKNIKIAPIQYVLIILCEMALFIIALSANGIMLDAITEGTQPQWTSRFFSYTFEHSINTSDPSDKKKLDRLLAEFPVDYEYMRFSIAGRSDDLRKQYYTDFPSVCVFRDYQSMKDYLNNNFQVRDVPTEQEYENHEKVILTSTTPGYVDENDKIDPILTEGEGGTYVPIGPQGELYKVVGKWSGVGPLILYGTEPEDTKLFALDIRTKNYITQKQADEIHELIIEIFNEEHITQYTVPNVQDLLDMRKNQTNIVVTVLTLILSAFNIILIFKQMIENRTKKFAVYSLCGFGQLTCISYCLIELLLISAISSIGGCLIFNFLVKPILAEHYKSFSGMFTIGYYGILLLLYVVIFALLFSVFIAPVFRKTVAEKLRSI